VSCPRLSWAWFGGEHACYLATARPPTTATPPIKPRPVGRARSTIGVHGMAADATTVAAFMVQMAQWAHVRPSNLYGGGLSDMATTTACRSGNFRFADNWYASFRQVFHGGR